MGRYTTIRSGLEPNLTMYEAFRASAVPYFQEVARRIGRDTMQRWLDTLSYGTKKITSALTLFGWMVHLRSGPMKNWAW
jgi:beta-lactamase class D